jgi:hypothetical protein
MLLKTASPSICSRTTSVYSSHRTLSSFSAAAFKLLSI